MESFARWSLPPAHPTKQEKKLKKEERVVIFEKLA
jgi:hypothetical protein